MTTDQMTLDDARVAVPLVEKMTDDQKHAVMSAQTTVRGLELAHDTLIEMELVDLGIAYPAMKMNGIRNGATLTTNGRRVRRHLLREGL